MTEISDRLFRVAALGAVPEDDQHVIADANDEIERHQKNSDLQMERAIRAETEIERLRAGYTSIMSAAVDGRVCDDVAWFDTITTLYEYCDAMLAGNEHLFADADLQQRTAEHK